MVLSCNPMELLTILPFFMHYLEHTFRRALGSRDLMYYWKVSTLYFLLEAFGILELMLVLVMLGMILLTRKRKLALLGALWFVHCLILFN